VKSGLKLIKYNWNNFEAKLDGKELRNRSTWRPP